MGLSRRYMENYQVSKIRLNIIARRNVSSLSPFKDVDLSRGRKGPRHNNNSSFTPSEKMQREEEQKTFE